MKNFFLLVCILSLGLTISCTEETISFSQQLALDVDAIDTFLKDNDIEAEVHESGIRYVIEEEGTGESIATVDTITAKYVGKYFSGEVFDSNDFGLTLPLVSFIEAWEIAVPLIKEGGKMVFYAPSGYCFGTSGNSTIPPNTNLIFEIDLTHKNITFDEQVAVDVQILDDYLATNNIEALIHESGIRYVINEEGTGDVPDILDVVEVTYEGRFISGQVFDENADGVSFQLDQLIRSWQIAVPLLKEGGEITIYAPSRYCYGPNIVGSIAPNTNLIFDIGLIQIVD